MKESKPYLYIHSDSGSLRVRVPGHPSRLFSESRYPNPKTLTQEALRHRDLLLKRGAKS